MTIKGIPLSDVMVRAERAGVKLQTRRIAGKYAVGDVLYVREAWSLEGTPGYPKVKYEADGEVRPWPETIRSEWGRVFKAQGYKRRPPMFMYRALARTWIGVTAHRVEALQHISRDDAVAEGSWWRLAEQQPEPASVRWQDVTDDPVMDFARAWDSIQDLAKHPERSWHANPLVHAYTFRRLSNPGGRA